MTFKTALSTWTLISVAESQNLINLTDYSKIQDFFTHWDKLTFSKNQNDMMVENPEIFNDFDLRQFDADWLYHQIFPKLDMKGDLNIVQLRHDFHNYYIENFRKG